jgi:leucyl aminopeptidase
MQTTTDAILVSCRTDSLDTIDADMLWAPVFLADDDVSGPDARGLEPLDRAVGGALSRARASGELTGALHQQFLTDVVDTAWHTRRVLLVGAGSRDRYNPTVARAVAATAGMAARQRAASRLVYWSPPGTGETGTTQAVVEGVLLGAFRDTRFKTRDTGTAPLQELILAFAGPIDPLAQEEAERGAILAECSNLARELANEPGNLFTPRVFAERAIELVTGPRTTVEVLDEAAIESEGMGLLLGVAQGSPEPPRVIVMRYEPEDPAPGPVLALVGKGVTFDTGGISIKPAAAMDLMKRDMSGGAAVLCAMRAIGRLAPPIRVIGIVPAAENMPDGNAIRPGDVLTAANGLRVEVLNTDAEGRLLLADALTLAQRLGATHLVDIATLTGAVVVALGHHTSGLVGTPPAWVETVRRAADSAGEEVWPLPPLEAYAAQLKSETADLANIGGRGGGAITAAMFLKEFSGGLPWAHLDIAGTAWYEQSAPSHPKGASGVGVRMLAELPFTLAREGAGVTKGL